MTFELARGLIHKKSNPSFPCFQVCFWKHCWPTVSRYAKEKQRQAHRMILLFRVSGPQESKGYGQRPIQNKSSSNRSFTQPFCRRILSSQRHPYGLPLSDESAAFLNVGESSNDLDLGSRCKELSLTTQLLTQLTPFHQHKSCHVDFKEFVPVGENPYHVNILLSASFSHQDMLFGSVTLTVTHQPSETTVPSRIRMWGWELVTSGNSVVRWRHVLVYFLKIEVFFFFFGVQTIGYNIFFGLGTHSA